MSALADTFRNADPASVDRELEDRTTDLDTLGKSLDAAVDALNLAEEAWDEKYDEVEESLKDEYTDLGRKAPPSEAAITSATRKQHRALYTQLRRAKRNVDKIEKQLQATRTVVSARQTQANGLRDEMKMGAFSR